jgi:hypothetical protein
MTKPICEFCSKECPEGTTAHWECVRKLRTCKKCMDSYLPTEKDEGLCPKCVWKVYYDSLHQLPPVYPLESSQRHLSEFNANKIRGGKMKCNQN